MKLLKINEIDNLIQLLSKLPGLGPRSARRAALHLIKNKDISLEPLRIAMDQVARKIETCSMCGNLDTLDPCSICADKKRHQGTICVVEEVADLWAIERSKTYSGLYHVLGGVLSPLDGVGPDELFLNKLLSRADESHVNEIILATSATVDGKTTAHYINELLEKSEVDVTALAHGIPVGGELDYLDDGTLITAIKDRRGL